MALCLCIIEFELSAKLKSLSDRLSRFLISTCLFLNVKDEGWTVTLNLAKRVNDFFSYTIAEILIPWSCSHISVRLYLKYIYGGTFYREYENLRKE